MLFPIGDDNQSRVTTPVIVYLIIVINLAVFILLQQGGMTPQGEYFTYGYAVVPLEITTGTDLTELVLVPGAAPVADPRTGRMERPVIPEAPGPNPIYLTLLTSMFMHGGWLHLLGNMLYLWIFGDNIEDNFGHSRFLVFYLICGLVAAFAQILADPNSVIPSLGASGAIAGVLGAYLVMFPRNRVRNLVFFGFFFTTIELPAVIVLGFWIVIQIVQQYMPSFEFTPSGGVAYMAHIGGFVSGLILCFFFRRKQTRREPLDYE